MLNTLQRAKLDIKFQQTMQNGLPPATLAEVFKTHLVVNIREHLVVDNCPGWTIILLDNDGV